MEAVCLAKLTFHGAQRGSASWADFDNDSDLDLFFTGFGSAGTVAKIYKNNGDKTFSEFTGVTLQSVEQGTSQWIDYDKDGDLDIYNSGFVSGNFVHELFELHNGTYSKLSSLGITNSGQVAFIDYDNDQDYDIFVPDDNYNFSRIYRNNLKTNPIPLDKVPAWPNDFVAHPANTSSILLDWRDNSNDETHFSLEMRAGDNGSFSEIELIPANDNVRIVQGLSPGVKYGFRIRSYNSFGYSRYSDVITSSPASNTFAKLPGVPPIYIPQSSSWADMDNDGDLDLLYSGHADQNENYISKIFIQKNNSGNFIAQAHAIAPMTIYDIDWADYDHDADLDLLISGIASGETIARTKLYINSGNFNFTEYTGSALKGVRSGFSRWVDINSDGYLDIYLSGTADNNNQIHYSQVLINKKDNTFQEVFDSGLPAFFQCDMEAADFNGDGRVDIAIGGFKDTLSNYSVTASEIYLNQGGNKFNLTQSLPASSIIESADFDQDGDIDIVLAGMGETSVIYRNQNGKFSKDVNNLFVGYEGDGDLTVGDVDSDGDSDIVVGGGVSQLKSTIYLNGGSGIFSEGYYPLSRVGYNQYSLGDFDQDGDLDLFEGGNAINPNFNIFRNETNDNSPPQSPVVRSAQPVASGIIFTWNRGADDNTPTHSLVSNVYLKDLDGKYLYNSIADINTGKLKAPAYGNTFLNDSILFRNLKPGVYTVGVQNIDNSFSPSAFSTTNVTVAFVAPTLVTTNPAACENNKVALEVLGEGVVWYKDIALSTQIGSGNIFEPTVKKNDTVFYAVQKMGIETSPILSVLVKVFNRIKGPITKSGNTLVAPVATTYQWVRNDTLLLGAMAREFSTLIPGNYKVKVTNNLCPVDIIEYILRPAKPLVTFDPEICIQDVQTLSATGTDITWQNKSGTEIGTGQTFTFNPSALADTVIFAKQKVNTVLSDPLKVSWKVHDYPGDKITFQGGGLVASVGLSYQWYLNNEIIPGATQRVFDFLSPGLYHAVVSNNECVTSSQKITITGLEGPDEVVRIYQNLDEEIIVTGTSYISHISIYDCTGREFSILNEHKRLLEDKKYAIDISGLKTGLYVMLVAQGKHVSRLKFIKN